MQLKTELEKMLLGELYDPNDPALVLARRQVRNAIADFNRTRSEETEKRQSMLAQLLHSVGTNVYIEPPFFCDYGFNIQMGDNVYLNFNCVILDPARVTIGDNVMIAPNVQIYTATHPINHQERNAGLELAKEITVGSDVWIGGGSILCPGVTVGARSVIGAGSVVTRDIPADVVAVGNPCRVLRSIV